MPRYAKIIQAAPRVIELPGKITLPFQRVPAGRFRMGARGESVDEEPVTDVVIPEDFYLGTFPVTQEQFAAWTETAEYAEWLAENADRLDEDERGPHENHFKGNPRHPAEQVSWWEAAGFSEWLNANRLVPEGFHARLPAEAEWEHACRAGTETEYYTGDGEEALAVAGWYAGNAGGTTHPVGEKKPNSLQIYDLHGNVSEWCGDPYVKTRLRELAPSMVADTCLRVPERSASDVNPLWTLTADFFNRFLGEEQGENGENRGIRDEDTRVLEWWLNRFKQLAEGEVEGMEENARTVERMLGAGVWGEEGDTLGRTLLAEAERQIRVESGEDQAHRVLRGGSWSSTAACCRSAFRNWYAPGNRLGIGGFRLALVPGPVPARQAGAEPVPGAGSEGTERKAEEAGGAEGRATLPGRKKEEK